MSSYQIRNRILFYKMAVFCLSVSILGSFWILVYRYNFAEASLDSIPYLLADSFFITCWICAFRRLKNAENLEMVQEIMKT